MEDENYNLTENRNYSPDDQTEEILRKEALTKLQELKDYVASGGKNEAQASMNALKVGLLFSAAKRSKIDVSDLELEMQGIQKEIDSLEEPDYIKGQQNNN